MKKLLICLLLLSPGGLFTVAHAQEHTESIKKEVQLTNQEGNELLIKNINGPVNIEGYDGNTILLEATRTVRAKSDKYLQEGMADLSLGVQQDDNTVVIYVDAPFATLKQGKSGRWNYHVHQENSRYEFEFDIRLRVPNKLLLEASTVNGGTVTVKNYKGPIEASHVNGGVELENVSGSSNARTVNGSITASLLSLPTSEVSYETVNGDIRVFYPESLAADVQFKTLNGDFYTDFEDISQKAMTKEKKGIKVYRVNKAAVLSVNGGGSPLHFKTLNGDIYLQKQK